jgi:hypothetical protein
MSTTIVRPTGAEPASTGAVHNPPCAGIEIAASSNGNSLVRVDHATISGFDIGIGINLWYNAALVENSTLSGNVTADVGTMWTGTLPLQYPVIDLGGDRSAASATTPSALGPSRPSVLADRTTSPPRATFGAQPAPRSKVASTISSTTPRSAGFTIDRWSRHCADWCVARVAVLQDGSWSHA